MERLAKDRGSVVLHTEFVVHASRNPELAKRFAESSSGTRLAVARYIDQYQEETGVELPLPADDLALVLRALGVGLAMESLVNADAVDR